MAWTDDGARLATASHDGTARLWNGRTGAPLATLEGHTKEVMALAWTDDGARLATASWDFTARLWDGRTGAPLATLEGHTNGVVALAWTDDGARLATTSRDGTARLWSGSPEDWFERGCKILQGSTGSIELDPQTKMICAAHRDVPGHP